MIERKSERARGRVVVQHSDCEPVEICGHTPTPKRNLLALSSVTRVEVHRGTVRVHIVESVWPVVADVCEVVRPKDYRGNTV